jgi:hypothetical protein
MYVSIEGRAVSSLLLFREPSVKMTSRKLVVDCDGALVVSKEARSHLSTRKRSCQSEHASFFAVDTKGPRYCLSKPLPPTRAQLSSAAATMQRSVSSDLEVDNLVPPRPDSTVHGPRFRTGMSLSRATRSGEQIHISIHCRPRN